MPRFGVQAATFASSWDDAVARRGVVAAAHLGFDALEIPLLRSAPFDYAAVRTVAQANGVELVCRTALPTGCSALLEAERVRALLGQAVQAAASLGATSLSGAFLLAPINSDATVSPGAGALLVELLADLALDAAARDVSLMLEPAHQFESPVINTVAQAVAIVRAVGAENLGLGLSTLQMHIGEPSLGAALCQAGPLLRLVRAEENSGGIPGSGAVRWDSLWQGLRESAFDGLIVLAAPRRAQIGARPTATIDAQLSRVRPETDLYPEEYAAEGLAFLKAGLSGNGAVQPEVVHAAEVAAARRLALRQGIHATGADDTDLIEPPDTSLEERAGLAKPGTKSYRNRR